MIKDYKLSLNNAKIKTKKNKMKIMNVKYTMLFCLSAIYTRNIIVIVNCFECEKLCLLFSTKKLSEKDKMML